MEISLLQHLNPTGLFKCICAAAVATDASTQDGRARERHRRLLLSAVASAAAKVITVATSLISVPLTLHYLGPEQYGIWMVLSSLTVMLSFADMGMGNGILNAVASAHGKDDRGAIREVVSSGYAVLALIAALIITAFALCYPHVSWYRLFNASTLEARAEAGPALAVFIVCFALAIPVGVVQRVQIGLQQSFLNSLWQALGSILALAAVLVTIYLRGSLPVLVLALVGTPLLGGLLNTAVFFRNSGRDVRPFLGGVQRTVIISVARVGGMFFLVQFVGSVAFGADTLIIAQVAGASTVAEYAVPERMFALISMVVALAMAPLWPAYAEAVARGDGEWVRRTFNRSLIVAALASATVSLTLVLLGRPLLNLWVGSAVQPSLLLLAALGVWRVVEACGNAMAYYMNGVNLLKVQATLGMISAVIKVLLKVVLVGWIGPAGIPLGSTIGFLLFAGFPFFFVIRRHMSTGLGPATTNKLA